MKPSQDLITRAKEIEQITTNFCNTHLTEEYGQLCVKLINKILKSPSASVLMAGRPISIASGIIQVISVNNYLSKSPTYPMTTDVIAKALGTSAGNISAKAVLLRKAAHLRRDYDPEYASSEALENNYAVSFKDTMCKIVEDLRKIGLAKDRRY